MQATVQPDVAFQHLVDVHHPGHTAWSHWGGLCPPDTLNYRAAAERGESVPSWLMASSRFAYVPKSDCPHGLLVDPIRACPSTLAICVATEATPGNDARVESCRPFDGEPRVPKQVPGRLCSALLPSSCWCRPLTDRQCQRSDHASARLDPEIIASRSGRPHGCR